MLAFLRAAGTVVVLFAVDAFPALLTSRRHAGEAAAHRPGLCPVKDEAISTGSPSVDVGPADSSPSPTRRGRLHLLDAHGRGEKGPLVLRRLDPLPQRQDPAMEVVDQARDLAAAAHGDGGGEREKEAAQGGRADAALGLKP